LGRSKRKRNLFDITLFLSILFLFFCLLAVWSIREAGMKVHISQPQTVLPETKSTPTYEPLRPLPKEEKPFEKNPVQEETLKDKHLDESGNNMESKREMPAVSEDKKVPPEEKIDQKVEETVKSFFEGIDCKIINDWTIEVPTFYSVEWIRRRLNGKLLELGYCLEGNTIYKNSEKILELRFIKSQPRGRIAIIIDDVGVSTSLNKILEDINLPLNISILPGQSKSKQMSLVGKQMGWDVLLHLPMEPREKSWVDSTFIKVGMDRREIEEKVTAYLQELPYVNGINNHMGSLATTKEDIMRVILGIVKDRGLYFIDSLTTPDSVGEKVSREIGLKRFAKRDIFLDNISDREYIRSQMDRLVGIGIKDGNAIGICHLRKDTLWVIKEYNWKDKEIELVLLSEIL
jgi:polysaccharide deacetylase 2 family uncharacterized protein YibQ